MVGVLVFWWCTIFKLGGFSNWPPKKKCPKIRHPQRSNVILFQNDNMNVKIIIVPVYFTCTNSPTFSFSRDLRCEFCSDFPLFDTIPLSDLLPKMVENDFALNYLTSNALDIDIINSHPLSSMKALSFNLFVGLIDLGHSTFVTNPATSIFV